VTGTFAFEPLGASHDRAAFSCGVPALDRYIRELATQDVRRRVSNCFVAVDSAGKIAGYYTFAATSLPLTVPPEQARRLTRYPSFPACLVGRLAVDQRFRGQGLGSQLIVDAIARAMRAEPAIFALIVDAKDEVPLGFYEHLGFQRFASRRCICRSPKRRGVSLAFPPKDHKVRFPIRPVCAQTIREEYDEPPEVWTTASGKTKSKVPSSSCSSVSRGGLLARQPDHQGRVIPIIPSSALDTPSRIVRFSLEQNSNTRNSN
jgi:ribosomal protein S18 acetylase RimI-like enzyme